MSARGHPAAVEQVMEENLALLRATLGRLLGARTSTGTELIQNVCASPVHPEVYFDFVSASQTRVRVKLSPLTEEGQAFVLTRSFTVSYRGETMAPLDLITRSSLALIAQELTSRDPGGRVLRAPGGAHGPDLFMSIDRENRNQHRWSREVFDRKFAAQVAAAGGQIERVILVVSQPCEQQCTFCPSVDRDKCRLDWMEKGNQEQHDDLAHQLRRARSAGATVADFGGNDVLRFAPILSLGRLARELGYSRVVVQSPALVMADPAFAEAVAASGFTEVQLPIYGTTPEVHDRITGTPGAFEKLCRALDLTRTIALAPTMTLHTIALGSTLGALPELIRFCQARFGLPLRVQPLRPNRTGERSHLGDAAGFAELRAVMASDPEPFQGEFPACLYPLDAVLAWTGHVLRHGGSVAPSPHLYDLGLSGEEHASVKRDRTHLFGATCSGCALRPVCGGVLGAHLERWGEGELRALS